MSQKQIRESECSKAVRSILKPFYDVLRIESRLEDGFADLLGVRRRDGVTLFIELKQVDHLGKDGAVRLPLDPNQPLFAWQRVKECEHSGVFIMIRVGSEICYTFPARLETDWVPWIKSRIKPESLSPPLCFRHRVSEIPPVLDKAWGARFTPALLPGAGQR